MAYLNITLLILGLVGIIYGTIRLVMAKKYVLAGLLTLFVSWLVIFIMLQHAGCTLQYLGIASDYMAKHIPYSTQRFIIRALTFKGYGPLLIVDMIGLAYAAVLTILPRLLTRARES